MRSVIVKLGAVLLALAVWSVFPSRADDTEIYQADGVSSTTARPKVLIVFDDSGSMSFMVDQQRPAYDPERTYDNKFGTDRIYWSTSGDVPSRGSDNWFNATQNRCDASYLPLEDNGVFQTTAARRWVGSTTIPGDCTLQCPEGTTWRRGDQGRACYEYTTYFETEERCTRNWVVVDRDEWEDYPGSLRRRERAWRNVCEDREVCRWRFDWEQWRWGRECTTEQFCEREQVWVYEVNQETCEDVEVEVTDWRYVGDRVEVCEDGTLVPGTWQSLDDDIHDPPHVDCRNDADAGNAGNGDSVSGGFPQNNVATGSEYGPTPDVSNSLWGDQRYTFYTSHYLDWYYDESLVAPRARLDIAQEVVSQLISSNPGIDFGLMEFNFDEGGRVVQRIIENMSAADRTNLISMVNRIEHAGSTPMCESMYEAFRYINGESVLYGYDRLGGGDSRGTYDVLPRDPLAESNGTYISPTTDCAYTYVILMTDGEPQRDTGANNRIESLTGRTCSRYRDADGNSTKNCLPELAEYMANTDLDGDSSNGNQYAITYTIGFATNQDLLRDAAERGKGEYYTANNAQELTEAFQGAIYSILSTDTTFTSPTVAVDTFTRTQSRDEIFYAMFKPTERVNWPGNIKKLKLLETDDGAVLVDANGNPAIDSATGFIKDTATTFWSGSEDGGAVERGGVGGRLIQRDPASRNILIDTGTNQALEAFDVSNFSPADFGVANDSALWSLFGASTEQGYRQQVAWARGFDAYDQDGDGSTNDPRSWIMGDILHSQPLVVNYGGSKNNQDMRLVVGTNAGFVHMFRVSDGEESWAFTPKALVDLHRQRRQNRLTSDNVYGMDLSPAVLRIDRDGDGLIEVGDGDRIYLYMGMRRGGRSLYALDISNPDSPAFLWSIGPSTSGFAEMGQTWSVPVTTVVPGYKDQQGKYKPVLVFGAGYDDRKDAGGVATPDSMGRGLFIVDAVTGALVWSVTPNANSTANLQESGLLHSVAAEVTAMDSDGDGVTDRIYFGDTGGNVWRVDMPGDALPGTTLPDGEQAAWHIVKLADINGGTVATDRRIHNAIDVVRTRFDGVTKDAVIFATGDRTNPNATDVQNRLYMIRDQAVSVYTTPPPTASECGSEEFAGDFRCMLPITDAQLYDITDNALANEEDEQEVLSALSSTQGWRMDLTGRGEKGLAKTLTLGNKIYATTFTPNDLLSDINICEPLSGSGKMYVVDLFNGDRTLLNLAPVIPDTPSVYFGADGTISLLLPPGTPPQNVINNGEGGSLQCGGGICNTGERFPQPFGNYWMQEEF